MKFKLEFDCDNAAFEGRALRSEVADCLLRVVDAIDDTDDTAGYIFELFGNTIGSWELG